MKALVFGARREGYSIDQIENPITVRELRDMLEGLDDDMIIVCGHDNEYTYGSLTREAEIREEREGEYGMEYDPVDVIYA